MRLNLFQRLKFSNTLEGTTFSSFEDLTYFFLMIEVEVKFRSLIVNIDWSVADIVDCSGSNCNF